MKLYPKNVVGFLIGYFIVCFVLFFGFEGLTYFEMLPHKLFWANAGLGATIIFGLVDAYFKKQLTKGGKQKNGKK